MPTKTLTDGAFKRLNAARISYNYCGVCGHIPQSGDEPNRAPLRWWDPDDGWKIGTLCRWCAEEVLDRKPAPEDYAVATRATNGVCDEYDTDEDPFEALF